MSRQNNSVDYRVAIRSAVQKMIEGKPFVKLACTFLDLDSSEKDVWLSDERLEQTHFTKDMVENRAESHFPVVIMTVAPTKYDPLKYSAVSFVTE